MVKPRKDSMAVIAFPVDAGCRDLLGLNKNPSSGAALPEAAPNGGHRAVELVFSQLPLGARRHSLARKGHTFQPSAAKC